MKRQDRVEVKPDFRVTAAAVTDARRIWTIYKTGRLASQANAELGITKQDVWEHLCKYDTERQPVYRQREEWQSRIRQPSSVGQVLVAEQLPSREVQGVVWPNIVDGERWLSKLYVANGVRRMGVASKLIEATLLWHHYEPVRLLVAAYNQSAIKLYERYDFQQVRELQSGYTIAGKPIPQIEMVWER
jgi:ribosomal protein S18 acetylase RimI-like enzyme